MKKLGLKIYFIFLCLILISEIFTSFKIFKVVLYSFNPEKYFEHKEMLYISSNYTSDNQGVVTGEVVIGKFKNEEEERKLYIGGRAKKYIKKNKNNKPYIDVWYQKKTNNILLKTDKKFKLSFNDIVIFIITYFLPLLIVPCYIKLSKK